MTAAMVEASCSATMRSSSSASSAPCSGSPREKALRRQIMGVRHVVDAGQQRAEHLAVGDDAADRDAAEADTVIAALAADQAGARALAAGALIGERDLERRVDRFRNGAEDGDRLSPRRATRTRLIGRERGYHGVNFGGISVGGIVGNRKMFGTLLAGVDHMPHTHICRKNAFTARRARARRRARRRARALVALHDASTIAAVIVEPVAGSAGVLIPPKGYLSGCAQICDKHGILLIFDEVITGFGRLGTPFAADVFRRHARHHDHRQGRHQRRHADGRGVREEGDPRRLHDRPRAHDRVLPRLHLFGAPDRLRGRRSARSTPTRKRGC